MIATRATMNTKLTRIYGTHQRSALSSGEGFPCLDVWLLGLDGLATCDRGVVCSGVNDFTSVGNGCNGAASAGLCVGLLGRDDSVS